MNQYFREFREFRVFRVLSPVPLQKGNQHEEQTDSTLLSGNLVDGGGHRRHHA
jgi:hypothetical protein